MTMGEVEPFDTGGLDSAALVKWYWSFGFRGLPDEMIREPRIESPEEDSEQRAASPPVRELAAGKFAQAAWLLCTSSSPCWRTRK